MSALFSQLGINVPALIAQSVNFLIVLIVLTFFVYRPLVRLMDERKRKIEEGLRGAKLADERLAEIAKLVAKRAAEAEAEALVLMQSAKRDADLLTKDLVKAGEARSEAIVKEARTLASRGRAEQMVGVHAEARNFIRAVVEKVVGLNPKLIDDALIEQAVKML